MEHIAAVLLIVGCSPDLSQCHELPAPVTMFETADDCLTTQPFTLDDLAGRAPRILGTCIAVDPAMEEEDSEIVWRIAPGGTLNAAIEMSNQQVASNDPQPEKDYIKQQ